MDTYRMYLVQRGDFRERENKFGIDKLITWDYMGSAEFEWDALPKAYSYIMDNFGEYQMYVEKDMANTNGVPLCIFCKRDDHAKVKATLDEFRKKPYGLKEYISFDMEYKTFEEHPVPRYDAVHEHFWFDIENHFMWFFGADDRVNAFTNALIADETLRNKLKEGEGNE